MGKWIKYNNRSHYSGKGRASWRRRTLGAALLLLALLAAFPAAAHEAITLGDYIYVPARVAGEETGGMTVRVYGLEASENTDVREAEPLSGVTLGVYVQNARAQMAPWANPISPAEPLRVTTGVQDTALNLPGNQQFYLRVESVPDGFLMPEDGFYPLTPGETVEILCVQPSRILMEVNDVMGGVYAHTPIRVTGEDGNTVQVETDENGVAILDGLTAGEYTVEEAATPEGALALSENSVRVTLGQAHHARVQFTHPQRGQIRVAVTLRGVDEKGKTFSRALSGVSVVFSGEDGAEQARLATDENGTIELPLDEGSYRLHLEAGTQAYALSVTDALAMVQNGMTTPVEIDATEHGGRAVIMLTGVQDADVFGKLSMTLTDAQGKKWGPFQPDAAGQIVTDLLEEGTYTLSLNGLPEEYKPDGVLATEAGDVPLAQGMRIVNAQATQAALLLRTMVTQRITFTGLAPAAEGETEREPLAGVHVEWIDQEGRTVEKVTADGQAQADVTLLSGTYTLRVTGAQAWENAQAQISIPDGEGNALFYTHLARAQLACVDGGQARVAGAQLRVTDAAGHTYTLEADASGRVLTPLLTPGDAVVETVLAPEGYVSAAPVTVTLTQGETAQADIPFVERGRARLSVTGESLAEDGKTVSHALADVKMDVLRLRQGADAADTGAYEKVDVSATTDARGMCVLSLDAGTYLMRAAAEADGGEYDLAACGVIVQVEDGATTRAQMVARAHTGGVRVTLANEELTPEQREQIDIALMDAQGNAVAVKGEEGAWLALGLEPGEYTLASRRMCEGYSPLKETRVSVSGGMLTEAEVALEKHARLSIDRRGVTFDENMQNYVLPIPGVYGVYVKGENGYEPYMREGEALSVTANDSGAEGMAELPASLEGTVYYLKEEPGEASSGYVVDEAYYPVTLKSGEETRVQLSATVDRGFFRVENVDALTGSPLTGARFALYRVQEGKASTQSTLTFTMEEAAYQNEKALPVGDYRLVMTAAATGYALDASVTDVYTDFTVMPYLLKGGTVTQVTVASALQAYEGEGTALAAALETESDGLRLRMADIFTQALYTPVSDAHLTAQLTTREGVFANVTGVTVGRVTSAQDKTARYGARVVYALHDGGWQFADMRTVIGLEAQEQYVDLTDAPGVVTGVTVCYFDTDTGLETLKACTRAQDVTVHAHVTGARTAQVRATASLTYTAQGLNEEGAKLPPVSSAAGVEAQCDYEAGSEEALAISAGVDGVIAGTIFEDANGDGLYGAGENGRAGVEVTLLTRDAQNTLSVYDRTQSGEDGTYRFADIPMGTYAVQVDLPPETMFTAPHCGQAYLSSAVTDTAFGQSDDIELDAQHTSHAVHAGVMRIARISGVLTLREEGKDAQGIGGAYVSLRPTTQAADHTVYAVTDERGHFTFDSLAPGAYVLSYDVPEGYAVSEAADVFLTGDGTRVQARLALEMGAQLQGMDIALERVGTVSGRAFIDENYDGRQGPDEKALEGAQIELISCAQEEETVVMRSVSGADGTYTFQNVRAGTYLVRVTLPGQYAFTCAGEENVITGTAGQTGDSPAFTLAQGGVVDTLHIGATIPAAMTVFVWQDTSMDGLRNIGEEGMAGVEIALVRLEDGQERERITKVTGDDGLAVFSTVSPGSYFIAYTMPGVWRTTVRREGENASGVEQSASAEGRSGAFTLLMGQQDAQMSIGVLESASISGVAFEDSDDNALYDAGENGAAGVLVELVPSGTQEAAYATVTDEQGVYTFDGIMPGRYRVRFTARKGQVFSGSEQTRARGCAPYSDTAVSMTDSINATPGASVENILAGVVTPARISGGVYMDENGNGVQDAEEGGLQGAVVTLATRTGRTTGVEQTTDEQGAFSFENVRPGSYTLRISLPEEYVFSEQVQPRLAFAQHTARSSLTETFTLSGADSLEAVCFGALTQGTLAGVVFNDSNFDGLRGETEGALRGAVIELLDEAGETGRIVTTGSDGAFRFAQLMPGVYRLRITLPDGTVYTAEGDSLTARSDGRVQESESLLLTMGERREDLLIGALEPAQLSGRVWMDENNNGRREAEEPALSGVELTLYKHDGENWLAVNTVTTGEDGAWRFEGAMPGTYAVGALLPEGYAFSRRLSGTNRVSRMPMEDGRGARGETMALEAGDTVSGYDIGAVRVGSITGTVYMDADYDGRPDRKEEGLSGVDVELLSQDGTPVSRTQTAQDGSYVFDAVRTGTYMLRFSLSGEQAFTRAQEGSLIEQTDEARAACKAFAFAMGEEKRGCDVGVIDTARVTGRIYTDNNFSGQQDAEEGGVRNAGIELISEGVVVATARTGEDGAFSFTRLRPGTYKVRIALPNESVFTTGTPLSVVSGLTAQEESEAQSGTAVKSELAVQGETAAFTLGMGEGYTLACPAIYTGSVSGRAFEDENVNGLYDDGERALEGTQVELLMRRDGELVSVAQTQVLQDGTYRFTYLWPGQYAVRFTLPDGYLFTDMVTYEPTRNSDAFALQGSTADTAEFVLRTGEKAEHADIGAIRPARLGDTVFVDENGNGILDFGETQLSGVTISLYKLDGAGGRTLTAQMQSDVYGYYRFNNLRPGEYVLCATLPEGYAFIGADMNGYTEIDSDITKVDGETGETDEFALASGQTRFDIDVGLKKIP